MNSLQESGAGPDRRGLGETSARRRWLALLAPIVVALGMAGLVVSTAWDSLVPATKVQVLPVVLPAAAAGSVAPLAREAAAEVEASKAPPVRGGGVTVQAAGWLEADPFIVACTALADGVIKDVLVLEGDRVEKDQVVARLVAEDAELALAKAEANVAQAEADLVMAQAERAAAQTNWDEPVERTRDVEVAQASLARTEAELAQLPALIAAEQARLERLQEELARGEEALASGGATDIEIIVLRKDAAAQAAAVEALTRRRAILDADRDRLLAELTAAQRNAQLRVPERLALQAAKASVQQAEAALAQAKVLRDEAKLQLERMVIRAPIDGYVQRRLKMPGAKVMLGMDDPYSAHIVHLYDPSQLQVRVDVPLADAAHVFAGQQCEVVVEVLPNETFAGVVSRITHEADIQKNTLEVKVHVIDPSPLLKPEMLTRVTFLPDGQSDGETQTPGAAGPGQVERVLQVPTASLVQSDGGMMAWVVRSRRGDIGIAAAAPVEMVEAASAAQDDWALVRSQLRQGDLVVVNPEGLEAGRRVRIVPAAAREGGAV